MLSLLDPERLKGAGTALGLLVGTFSLLIAATHFAKKAYKEVAFLLLVTTALPPLLFQRLSARLARGVFSLYPTLSSHILPASGIWAQTLYGTCISICCVISFLRHLA